MNRSIRLATIAGIDVKMHLSFLLVLGLGAFQWGTPYGAAGAIFGVVLMLLLFACVLLHEFGHALVAQRFGLPVSEIVLLPIGGVALLKGHPRKPVHELLIAVAGPLVNVVIAAVLVLIGSALGGLTSLGAGGLLLDRTTGPSLATLIRWLVGANTSLVLFNLIPAFPLDGGRMLRAILDMGMSFRRATAIAVAIGQFIAVALGIFGILSGNIVLALVAAFIFMGAGAEGAEGHTRAALATLCVGDAYNRHAVRLAPTDRVSKVVDYLLTSYQPDFAVVDGQALVGIVTREDVLRSLDAQPEDVPVSQIMRRNVVRVEAAASLDDVRRTMSEKSSRVAAVYDGADFLGLVSLEDIGEALAILTFLQRRQATRSEVAAASKPRG